MALFQYFKSVDGKYPGRGLMYRIREECSLKKYTRVQYLWQTPNLQIKIISMTFSKIAFHKKFDQRNLSAKRYMYDACYDHM